MRLFSCGALICPALCIPGVLGVLAWLGASPLVIVLGGLFLVAVAVARSTLWRGSRPALAALLTGSLIGVFILCYLLPGVQVWFYLALAYSNYYATQLVVEMILVVPVCAALGYAEHILLSVCSCAGAVIRGLYSTWRAKERLPSALPAGLLWRTALYALAAAVIILLYRPLEIRVCSYVARNFFVRAMEHGLPPFPVEAWLMRLQWGSFPDPYSESAECFLRVYEACRDRLVASGALVHRRFVFKYVKGGTDEETAVWRALRAEFPENIHTTMPYNPGRPIVIEVYAPPDEIPRWEQFVREHDVPGKGKGG